MKQHVNLMSNSAKVQTMVRTRIRQWAVAYACTVAVLAPLLFAAWWPVYQESLEVASLEAQYEPIRKLRLATNTYKKQINQVHAKEQTTLTLAKIDTPVVTLLGVVGKAVTESKGNIIVEELNFDQGIVEQHEIATDPKPIIEIQGYGIDQEVISHLQTTLQKAFPFGKVAIEFSEPDEIHKRLMYRFSILCNL